ncbi:MAG: hypothetical protein PWR10_1762 [Halanaerobiales bacterium]|nr:hypothetical protein [Halanaerobiales bacterium]
MDLKDRYNSLIKYYSDKYGLDWKLVKKQILAESDAVPTAVSPVGAKGLMQFMKPTWDQWDDKDNIPALDDPFNPEENIEAGCKYMAYLYSKYPEIPDKKERYKFALAAYNAGRGNINKMLAHARKATGLPFSYAEWDKAGKPSGEWQKWDFACRFLSVVTGKHSKETISYVKKIMGE